jgi:hypothetical protein
MLCYAFSVAVHMAYALRALFCSSHVQQRWLNGSPAFTRAPFGPFTHHVGFEGSRLGFQML